MTPRTPQRADSSDELELSVVSPVYRAEDTVDELVRQLHTALSDIANYEIILVDDGSPDGSWAKVDALCAGDSRVKGIRLTRNFGQHYALTAGLEHSRGKYTAVIDCDLQENPADIPRLIAEAKKGFDIVFTERRERNDSPAKTFFANLYYVIYNFLTESERGTPRKSNLSLMSERAREAFCRVRDTQRHYLLILQWIGFPSSTIEIDRQDRHSGKSSYDFWKLVNHAIDGIVSQSTLVLRLSVLIGLIVSFVSLLGSAWLIVAYFVKGFKEGWASLAVLTLSCTGFVLLSVGVASLYIGKIFEQVKGRPLYIVQEMRNFSPEDLRSEIRAQGT